MNSCFNSKDGGEWLRAGGFEYVLDMNVEALEEASASALKMAADVSFMFN